MNLQETKIKMNLLCQQLMDDIVNVRNGKLDIPKAKTISSLSSNAIKASTGVAVVLQHHEIQLKKLVIREKELEFKKQINK